MTKEQMIEKVEVAHKIYEIIKVIPVNERGMVFNILEQYSRKDWDELHKAESAEKAKSLADARATQAPSIY